MRAIHCVRYGEPEDLVFVDVPSPQAGPGETVIAVEAVGLGFADGLNVRGWISGQEESDEETLPMRRHCRTRLCTIVHRH